VQLDTVVQAPSSTGFASKFTQQHGAAAEKQGGVQ
jgi:hypothetical protein